MAKAVASSRQSPLDGVLWFMDAILDTVEAAAELAAQSAPQDAWRRLRKHVKSQLIAQIVAIARSTETHLFAHPRTLNTALSPQLAKVMDSASILSSAAGIQ